MNVRNICRVATIVVAGAVAIGYVGSAARSLDNLSGGVVTFSHTYGRTDVCNSLLRVRVIGDNNKEKDYAISSESCSEDELRVAEDRARVGTYLLFRDSPPIFNSRGVQVIGPQDVISPDASLDVLVDG